MNNWITYLKKGWFCLAVIGAIFLVIGLLVNHTHRLLIGLGNLGGFIGVLSLYLFLVFWDIERKRMFGLKWLNRLSLLTAVGIFVYFWFVIDDPWVVVVCVKILIFSLFNLIVMTILKFIVKWRTRKLLLEIGLFLLPVTGLLGWILILLWQIKKVHIFCQLLLVNLLIIFILAMWK